MKCDQAIDLEWRLHWIWGSNVITGILLTVRLGSKVRIGVEDGRSGHEEMQVVSKAGKDKDTDCLLQPLERINPADTLYTNKTDFGLRTSRTVRQ